MADLDLEEELLQVAGRKRPRRAAQELSDDGEAGSSENISLLSQKAVSKCTGLAISQSLEFGVYLIESQQGVCNVFDECSMDSSQPAYCTDWTCLRLDPSLHSLHDLASTLSICMFLSKRVRAQILNVTSL